MTMEKVDIVVVGLGAMGSATLYQLARRGADVLGIDRYSPPHEFGSTHGDTRISRLAIGEGEFFVPFVQRSHEIWRELESITGESLLVQTGGLIFGPSDGESTQHGVADFLGCTIDAARRHGIRHDVLPFEALQERYPQFQLRGTESAYYEYESGYVRPEKCVRVQLDLAVQSGARMRTNCAVEDIEPTASGFRLTTEPGDVECSRIVLTCGSWVGDLAGETMAQRIAIYRQTLFWFKPRRAEFFSPDRLPIFIWANEDEEGLLYGFPEIEPGGGVKIASEQYQATTHPDSRVREVSEEQVDEMRLMISDRMPMLTDECIKAVSCLYTCTPDFSFVIDDHPDWPGCLIVSPCSGHGFKHSAAIGEAVACQALGEDTSLDVTPFSLTRF